MKTFPAKIVRTLFWLGTLLLAACGGPPSQSSTPIDIDLDDSQAIDVEAAEVAEGEKALRAENFSKAKQVFEEILARHPDHPKANHYLAVVLEQLDDVEGAVKHYRLALASPSPLNDSVMNLSALFIDAERFQEAVDILVPMIQRHPQDRDLQINLAYARIGLQDFDGAIAPISRARELAEGDIEVLSHCADLFRLAHSPKMCIATLDNAIKARPTALLYANRGLCKQANKDMVGAKADFQKSLSVDSNLAHAHYLYGTFLMTVEGNKSAAIKEFEACARLSPESNCKQLADEARK